MSMNQHQQTGQLAATVHQTDRVATDACRVQP